MNNSSSESTITVITNPNSLTATIVTKNKITKVKSGETYTL